MHRRLAHWLNTRGMGTVRKLHRAGGGQQWRTGWAGWASALLTVPALAFGILGCDTPTQPTRRPPAAYFLCVRQPAPSEDAPEIVALDRCGVPRGQPPRRDPLAPFVREPYDGPVHAPRATAWLISSLICKPPSLAATRSSASSAAVGWRRSTSREISSTTAVSP